MATFLFDKVIFGPVFSRRLGISLGINLLPNDSKLCNFNCIYCECGWTSDIDQLNFYFHPRVEVKEKLNESLLQMKQSNKQLDVITFAGNGEPTTHPDFAGIIDDTIDLRNLYFPKARIAVLSNGTMAHKKPVFDALNKIEQNILKLDSALDDTVKIINTPPPGYSVRSQIEKYKNFSGNVIVQTMFLQGMYNGVSVDNTTELEVSAWFEAIKQISPKQVMIYTIARETPAQNLTKVSMETLNTIGQRVEQQLGIEVQISG